MNKFILVFCLSLLSVFYTQTANAADPLLSLKNLERERASFIKHALSESDDLAEKQDSTLRKLRQLSDMERMVIRDDRLVKQNNPVVQNAFNAFELTFLVHASAENEQIPLAHWLNQVGFNSQGILNARAGYRK